jgi:hypothetical protein
MELARCYRAHQALGVPNDAPRERKEALSMRLGVLMVAGMLIVGGATVSRAEINCRFVLKNLSLPGRTVQSVAETMSISEET